MINQHSLISSSLCLVFIKELNKTVRDINLAEILFNLKSIINYNIYTKPAPKFPSTAFHNVDYSQHLN